MERHADAAPAGAGVDPVLSGQRGLDLLDHGGWVPERDDVTARGTVSQCPVRRPAQRGSLLNQFRCQPASVLVYRRQPDPGQQLDGRKQPDGGWPLNARLSSSTA